MSDLHLGKASHFRKNGIAVPVSVAFDDLMTLDAIFKRHDIQKIYFLGDLFHSDINTEWEIFSDWLRSYKNLQFFLIKGNHDILPKSVYERSNLEVRDEIRLGPFIFTHDRVDHDQFYNISGHIHPCVRLRGEARQGLRIPCFYFGEKNGILPAFGRFTGTHPIRVFENDKIFAVAEGKIIRLFA